MWFFPTPRLRAPACSGCTKNGERGWREGDFIGGRAGRFPMSDGGAKGEGAIVKQRAGPGEPACFCVCPEYSLLLSLPC